VLEVEEAAVALDLGVERRLAIDEDDGEAELLREEVAGRLDIGDEELRCRGADDGLGRGSVRCCGMASIPDLSACQLSNPACLATSSCASPSLKLAARISRSLRCRKRGSTVLICAATG
jgi:hypothetical protein